MKRESKDESPCRLVNNTRSQKQQNDWMGI